MPNGSFVREDFKVVTTLKGLVTEKVNLIEFVLVNELEAIGLIPSGREAVKGNLSSDAVGQVQIGKLLSHGSDHILADIVLQIELFVIVAFRSRAVASNGRNVEHSTAEFNKSSTLQGNQKWASVRDPNVLLNSIQFNSIRS